MRDAFRLFRSTLKGIQQWGRLVNACRRRVDTGNTGARCCIAPLGIFLCRS